MHLQNLYPLLANHQTHSDSISGFFVIFFCRTPGEEKWATWAPARSTAQHAAGEHLGLALWTRFTPGEKFELCDYL